jgi:uncharacterized protein (TIRG00374 family)
MKTYKGKAKSAKKAKDNKESFSERAKENKEDFVAIRKSRDKKSHVQLISGIIFTVAMTALIISLILSFGDMKDISDTFASIAKGNNWVYLLIAFFLTLGYFVFWPFSLISYKHALSIKCSFWDMYAIGDSEHFYNDVTPSYSGGQPFQIFAMKSIGIDTGKATGAILATFATYLLVTNIFCLVALIFFPYYMQGFSNSAEPMVLFKWTVTPVAFVWIVGVGYFMNLMTLVCTFALGLSKHVRKWIISFALWLTKFKLARKFLRKLIPTFIRYCKNAQLAFKEITTHKKHFLVAFLARLASMVCYYSIPFFLLKAVGVSFDNVALGFWLVFFGTSFAITAVCWLPTPGSTGGVEIAFAIVMTSLLYVPGVVSQGTSGISGNSALIVSLLWRCFTYYFILFLSLIVSLAFQIRLQKRLRKERKELTYAGDKLLENKSSAEIKEITNESKEK